MRKQLAGPTVGSAAAVERLIMRVWIGLIGGISVAMLAAVASEAKGSEVPEVRCAKAPCQFRMEGGSFYLRLRQSKIGCQVAKGAGKMESSASGTTFIGFSGCREEVTPFTFSCANAGGPLGTIQTSPLSSSTYLEGVRPSIQFGGEMSFVCGGLEKALHIEGYFSGEIGPRACDATKSRYPIRMKLIAHGREGSGPNYDVYVNGYGGEEYEFTPPWRLAFASPARFTC